MPQFISFRNPDVQAKNAMAAGAAALVLANSNANGYFRLSPDPGAAAPSIPVFSVPLSTYSLLTGAIQLGSTLKMRIQTYALPSGQPSSAILKTDNLFRRVWIAALHYAHFPHCMTNEVNVHFEISRILVHAPFLDALMT